MADNFRQRRPPGSETAEEAAEIDPRLWFLRDVDAFAIRFVLSEVLAEPRSRRPMESPMMRRARRR